MDMKIYRLVAVSASLVLMLAAACPAFASGVEWKDYESGMKAARSEGKPALVSFSTSWCGVCKKMDKDVFSDKAVADRLGAGFVCIKVDGDARKDLTGRHRVFSYPTNIVFDADGNAVNTSYGYMSKDEFLKLLDYVSTGSCKGMTFKEYIKAH